MAARARNASPAPRSSAYTAIYAVVRRVPRGRVSTYGAIAELAKLPRQARLVGYAMHALPDGSPLPWHRILSADGRLGIARLSPSGALTQRMRLEREGVGFDARGRVKLERFGWPRARFAARPR
ncbi:MAG: methyltransferase [Candidatus Eisenbacteria bacterium]|uniref:Methyltransferase n=1 Tax=Eiseniibacteriota bacterium TaxID=2212470 RepID=A0A849SN29_UNCEI|nr:methyltransferase [Candidatus Eisenbacteria bacterium]